MDVLEEEIQEPITDPSEIIEYIDNKTGRIYQFQIFPNLGQFRKFSSNLITNYAIVTVRVGAETIYGKLITTKKMERLISENKLQKIES